MVIAACFAMLSAVPMMLLGGLQSSLWCRGKCLGPIQFVVSWQVPGRAVDEDWCVGCLLTQGLVFDWLGQRRRQQQQQGSGGRKMLGSELESGTGS